MNSPSPQQPSPQQPSQQQPYRPRQGASHAAGELNGATPPDPVERAKGGDENAGAQAGDGRETAAPESASPKPRRRRGPERKPRRANGADSEAEAATTSPPDHEAPGVGDDAGAGVEKPTESVG